MWSSNLRSAYEGSCEFPISIILMWNDMYLCTYPNWSILLYLFIIVLKIQYIYVNKLKSSMSHNCMYNTGQVGEWREEGGN